MELQGLRKRQPRTSRDLSWNDRRRGADPWDPYVRQKTPAEKREDCLDLGVWAVLLCGLLAAAGLILFSLHMMGLVEFGGPAVLRDGSGREILCRAGDGWYATPAGHTAELPCRNGSGYVRRRQCSVRGEWLPEAVGQCGDCPAGLDKSLEPIFWEMTPAGKTVFRDCPPEHRVGTLSRTCTYDGYWEPPDDSCHAPSCPLDGIYPETKPGDTVRHKCPVGYGGVRSRRCDESGKWEVAVNTCYEL